MAVLNQNASLSPSVAETAEPSPRVGRAMVALAVIAGLLILGTAALWAHYGTAVFYEMVLAGLAACF